MPKFIESIIECPFYKGEGNDYIACEGIINGTVDRHHFKSYREKMMFEMGVCSAQCGKKCIHYKRINELYDRGLR